MFPEKQPSKVVLRTKDGKRYEEYLEYPKGDPREPMTTEDLDAKFAALSANLLSSDRQREVKEAIFSAETMTCRDFMQQLVV
jgi:2-methylcitrate dehydratase